MREYKVYDCDRCGNRYKAPLHVTTGCAVMHSPGSCCHYLEQLIDKEEGKS